MTTFRLYFTLFFVATAMFFSCKNNTSNSSVTENTTLETLAESAIKSSSEGKYAIKSGIVEYKTQMMGMDAKQILTFDDYGKLEIQDIEMEIMGTIIHTATLIKDGFIYQMDLIQKTGVKSVATSANNMSIDFENLSEQMAIDMNLKKLGKEEFLGKTCEKMSIDYKKMQMKGTYLVYKGIALFFDTDLGAMKMKMTAEKFIENPKIPADKFEVPSDIVMAN